MRLRIRRDRALFAHKGHTFGAGRVQHGPQTWPWWRVFSIGPVRANPCIPFSVAPVIHWNVWLYSRWGATYWHVGMDCRKPLEAK